MEVTPQAVRLEQGTQSSHLGAFLSYHLVQSLGRVVNEKMFNVVVTLHCCN
jgi:hypothetical protein